MEQSAGTPGLTNDYLVNSVKRLIPKMKQKRNSMDLFMFIKTIDFKKGYGNTAIKAGGESI